MLAFAKRYGPLIAFLLGIASAAGTISAYADNKIESKVSPTKSEIGALKADYEKHKERQLVSEEKLSGALTVIAKELGEIRGELQANRAILLRNNR